MAEEGGAWFKLGTEPGLRFLKEQLAGLEHLGPLISRCSILDLGCAEGLISKYYVDTFGADIAHGIEILPERVQRANELVAGYTDMVFHVGNMDHLDHIGALPLRSRYDVVLALAVLHKLKDPFGALKWAAARCDKYLVLRLPKDRPEFSDSRSGNKPFEPIKLLSGEFELKHEAMGPRREWTGTWVRR